MEEWLKNLLGDSSAWSGVGLLLLNRFINGERAKDDEMKDDIKRIEVRQDKQDVKIDRISEFVSELRGRKT